MRMMTDAEEKRLATLEQKIETLLVGRERMSVRIMRLREFIARNCQHSALDTNCPTCEFLKEDAS